MSESESYSSEDETNSVQVSDTPPTQLAPATPATPATPQFKDEDIPGVSIITPTYNRGNTIKLAVVNFLSFDYPKDKLEWIIIDDGDKSILDTLPDDKRIKYYYFDEKSKKALYTTYISNLKKKHKKSKSNKPIKCPHYKAGHFINNRIPLGMKRNLGIAYAKYDHFVHMDDDDYYPKDSIKIRIFKMLENPKIVCLGCTQLNQFHTTKLASIKTKMADDIRASARIYESTLCYTRKFWDQQHFDSSSTTKEGIAFFKNRASCCDIIEPTNIIVSLIHQNNEDTVKGLLDIQPNGWHFEQIPDELFLLITSF